MANSMGSLYIGAAGLRNSQNAINTTANNLTNLNTTGYVRQQVLFSDRDYITFGYASISDQQAGLGVTIGDVVHARDIFLDKSYRLEAGRQSFYDSYNSALDEIQTFFQEMEGTQYQEGINNFWQAVQTLATSPADTVNQNLILQKASLFLSRSQAVTEGLENYQDNINIQIKDKIDRINEIGARMLELNLQIQKIEAGGMETAMTLRDERDSLLDELGGLARIDYKETADGIVKVNLEGVPFVGMVDYHEIGTRIDKTTGYATPYWKYLSSGYDKATDTYQSYKDLYNFNTEISSEYSTDIGALKALILARGNYQANYSDLDYIKRDTQGKLLEQADWIEIALREDDSQYTAEEKQRLYATGLDHTGSPVTQIGIGSSCMMNTEAEIDRFLHEVVTRINDAFCPNTTAKEALGMTTGFPMTVTGTDGKTYTVNADTKFLDAANSYVGSDGKLPPQELFVRNGCDRYTEVTYTDAAGNTKTAWMYNEEDLTDTAKMYTTKSLTVNQALVMQPSLLPGYLQNGEVAQPLGARLSEIWGEDTMTLNQLDTEDCTFKEFYNKLISSIASEGNVYQTMSTSLEGTVQSIENQRQQVIGVSSDEELQSLIKYQNAYNAASRYMNVISEMMETIINNL